MNTYQLYAAIEKAKATQRRFMQRAARLPRGETAKIVAVQCAWNERKLARALTADLNRTPEQTESREVEAAIAALSRDVTFWRNVCQHTEEQIIKRIKGWDVWAYAPCIREKAIAAIIDIHA